MSLNDPLLSFLHPSVCGPKVIPESTQYPSLPNGKGHEFKFFHRQTISSSSGLQDMLPGLMWELEQQLGLLRLNPEKTPGEAAETDSWPSSGSYSRIIGRPESRLGFASERPKSVGDVANSSKDGTSRGTVPRSFSAPYSTSQDYPENPKPARYPPDPFLYPSPLHAVALQSPLLRSHLYEDSAFASAASQALAYPPDQDGFAFYDEAASHCHKVESYISRLIRRRSQLVRGSKPRTSLGSEPNVVRQNSLCKRPLELLPPPQSERKHPPSVERGSSTPSPCGHEGGTAAAARIWSSWDAAAERTLSTKVDDYSPPPPSSLKKPPKLQALAHMRSPSADQYEAVYPSSPLPDRESTNVQASYDAEEGACLMVKAQYIPAQQPSRVQQAHHRPGKKKPPPLTKGRSVELSPERVPLLPRERPRVSGPPKKCRFTEDGSGDVRKASGRKSSPRSRKAARSQSENSLLNKPGVKYGTAERHDEAATKPSRQRRPHIGSTASGCRKWRSTAEICQEELSPGNAAEASRGQRGVTAIGYTYNTGSDSECPAEPPRQAPTCRMEEGLVYGDSESSVSDGDSPAVYSSGASSDTDESGGLVWPQQLSPQLVSASGPGKTSGGQPKVFVKIKASHALKKKIMRFRSGSLKVMTTV
uniref:Dishevelled binding antagonist of beta catenin 3 n=1 Tax=Anolis carolinensis TaxID=28377 RepID=A0A803TMK5_ANOCA